MPTIPSGPPGLTPSDLHRHRQAAESFGVDAARYDRTRPRYPEALIARIAATSPGPEVLDVGCGTGIAARQFEALGCRVLGVDVDARMADFARRGGLAVEVAPFEAWDPAGRRFDAVTAGQTWHWVDPVAGAAKAAQVLRPGGLLAAFWNVGQPPPEAAAAFVDVARRVVPELPNPGPGVSALDLYAVMFGKAAEGIRAAGAFDDPAEWRSEWERTYSRDEWLDQLPTQGMYTRLQPERLAELLAGTGAVIDAMGGAFTMHFTAVAVTATRRP